MRSLALSAVISAAILISACGGGGSGDNPPSNAIATNEITTQVPGESSPDPTSEFELFEEYVTPDEVIQCSAEDIKRRVDWDMRDYYIYYDQVPVLDLDDYESPEQLIRDLRVSPDDYSYVSNASSQTALFEEGRVHGLGFVMRPAKDGVVRFKEVLEGSPADAAGLIRGDEVVTVDGRVPGTIPDDEFSAIFLAENSPVLMTIRTGTDDPRSVSVAHETYNWRTAGPAATFTRTSDPSLPKVGYLPIRSFLLTTEAEIDKSLNYLRDEGATDELIIDLRYNGGGRTKIARYLGAVIGGAAVAGEVITQTKWNDKYSSQNSVQIFEEVNDPLNLPRVFVLTTDRTASASEIFINSLKPFIEVVVVGETTEGKIFTSNAKQYCGKSINAMRSVRTNSVGVSVQGGIQPDCFVEDNWETKLQTTKDPLVSGAVDVIWEDGCNTIAADATSSMQRSASPSQLVYEPEDLTRFMSDGD